MEHKPLGRVDSLNRTDRTDRTDQSDSARLRNRYRLSRSRRLRPGGGYRKLRSFQTATLIYDGTVAFCERFVEKRSRTRDQMVQAARSGRQNIAEGSRAGSTSSQSEVRLTNVARASLDELLLDYEDLLRQRNLRQWTKDDSEARTVRRIATLRSHRPDRSEAPDSSDSVHWRQYAAWLEHKDPMVVANTLICLIHQANYLLDRQLAALERAIIKKGGYSERLMAARIAERSGVETDSPVCPRCGKPMELRRARRGKNAGSKFWGCCAYPSCRGTLPA